MSLLATNMSSLPPQRRWKLVLLGISILFGCSLVQQPRNDFIGPCGTDSLRQKARSKELENIVKADQKDRLNWNAKTFEELRQVARRDALRRMRVGEIFGEGCFYKAEDYTNAALVYQHGDAPDHFFQAFLWARRAVELGDTRRKRLMALAVDRYLVSGGYKQLFASQALKLDERANECWCLQQVEPRFPDALRKSIGGKSLSESLKWLAQLNNGKSCPNRECSHVLKPSPKGTVPGIW